MPPSRRMRERSQGFEERCQGGGLVVFRFARARHWIREQFNSNVEEIIRHDGQTYRMERRTDKGKTRSCKRKRNGNRSNARAEIDAVTLSLFGGNSFAVTRRQNHSWRAIRAARGLRVLQEGANFAKRGELSPDMRKYVRLRSKDDVVFVVDYLVLLKCLAPVSSSAVAPARSSSS